MNVLEIVLEHGIRTSRKARSLVLISSRRLASIVRIILIRLSNESISIPWSTMVARGVDVRITDGGSLQIGRSVALGANTFIQARSGHIRIGDATFIGSGCAIVSCQSIFIGKQVLIAEYVTIRDQDHRVDTDEIVMHAGFICAPISIKDGGWIGAKASILNGATLGEGAIVGAHALVKGDVPDKAIVAGVPARLLRFRKNRPSLY